MNVARSVARAMRRDDLKARRKKNNSTYKSTNINTSTNANTNVDNNPEDASLLGVILAILVLGCGIGLFIFLWNTVGLFGMIGILIVIFLIMSF